MTRRDEPPPRLWGRQYPFERTHLQRSLTLLGLAGVFAVTTILLVHADVVAVLGLGLVGAGLVTGLAAASRARYVRETRLGFSVLRARDGSFVLGSAAAFAAVAVLVVLLIVQ